MTTDVRTLSVVSLSAVLTETRHLLEEARADNVQLQERIVATEGKGFCLSRRLGWLEGEQEMLEPDLKTTGSWLPITTEL